MTNKELFNLYQKLLKLEINKNKLSTSTKQQYDVQISKCLNTLDELGVLFIDCDNIDLLGVIEKLNLTGTGIKLFASAMSTFYKVLKNSYEVGRKLTKGNPALDISRPVTKAKAKEPLSFLELENMYEYCKSNLDLRTYAILKVFNTTGMRVSELIALTLEQYQNRDENGFIWITVTKRSKPRFIKLNQECIDAIEDYLKIRKHSEYDNLFISNSCKPMSQDSMIKTWKRIGVKVGLEESRISNHLMRANCATHLFERGISVSVISELLGHASETTTRNIYIKENEVSKKALLMAI